MKDIDIDRKAAEHNIIPQWTDSFSQILHSKEMIYLTIQAEILCIYKIKCKRIISNNV